jgi:NADH-quinone oxidoreductase subunit I
MMTGSGIFKGLVVTARNLFGSYYDKRRLTTVSYPEEVLEQPERARTVPFLVFDGEDAVAGLRCTACTICEQECPANCIHIVKDTVKKPDYVGKMQLQPKVFDIDISVCMACGICAEVCPFDSIKMDPAWHWVAPDRFVPFLLHKNQLARPNSYFVTVHPSEAAEVDAARAEEVKKAAAKAAASVAPAAAAKPKPAPEPVAT